MEACSSSHLWARELEKLGRRAVLLPPRAVRPYVRRDKTDRADAEGILEAFRNKEIRSVPVKTVAQHTVTAFHGMRSVWLETRRSRINTCEVFCARSGSSFQWEPDTSCPRFPNSSRAPSHASPTLYAHLCTKCVWRSVDSKHECVRRKESSRRSLARCRSSCALDIPGIGLLTATQGGWLPYPSPNFFTYSTHARERDPRSEGGGIRTAFLLGRRSSDTTRYSSGTTATASTSSRNSGCARAVTNKTEIVGGFDNVPNSC